MFVILKSRSRSTQIWDVFGKPCSINYWYIYINNIQWICFYSDDKGKSRLIREEDHDRSDDDDSQDRLDMTVNTEARDKEKRREAFLASQVPLKCEFLCIINFRCVIYV